MVPIKSENIVFVHIIADIDRTVKAEQMQCSKVFGNKRRRTIPELHDACLQLTAARNCSFCLVSCKIQS